MRLFAGTPFDIPPTCDRCGLPEADCRCPPPPPAPRQFVPPAKQTAKLALEKRKNGKVVTVIRGLAAADNDHEQLLKQLKNHCGAGGTSKEDLIEIQGDHLARIRDLLSRLGYRVK